MVAEKKEPSSGINRNENPIPPSTPPRELGGRTLLPRNEKTPGRIGPIKPERFNLPSPDIKPFKGPKGKKVRKTYWEKEEEYRQFILANEDHCFHELHVCFKKGLNGSPTYDKSGFELDFQKVAHRMQPSAYNKSAMVRNMEKYIDQKRHDEEKMAHIFFEKGEAPENRRHADAWKDRVSKDLYVPWHKIGVDHFVEWEKKGFPKAKRGEYETFTEEERARLLRLLSGASLRL